MYGCSIYVYMFVSVCVCVCVCVILYLKPEFTLYISFITIILYLRVLMIELYRKISYNIVLLKYMHVIQA